MNKDTMAESVIDLLMDELTDPTKSGVDKNWPIFTFLTIDHKTRERKRVFARISPGEAAIIKGIKKLKHKDRKCVKEGEKFVSKSDARKRK